MKKLVFIFMAGLALASCGNMGGSGGGSDKEAANRERMQAFYDQVFNARNADMVDSFCHSDFTDHNPDPGKTGKGAEELKANFKELFAGFPDLQVKTNLIIAQGDTAVAYVTMSGTNTGPMMGMPATNKQISIEGIDIVILKDGKATDRWGQFDNMKMMQQLGLAPEHGDMPPPPADSNKKM